MADPGLYILAGPVRSGKTSSLIQWAEGKEVYGILTPDKDGRRVFMNAHTKETFSMEAAAGETDTLIIGRFNFSKTNFDKAVQVIRDAMNDDGWLIIDEIGPLELKGEGFHDVLREVIATVKKKVLIVVREGLVEKVKQHFAISGTVINTLSLP